MRVRLEDDLTQLSALLERVISEHLDAAGDNQLLYVASAEPVATDCFKARWQSEYLWVCLTYAELLRRLLNLRRKLQTRDLCAPEAEPADFLDIIIQLELL